MKKLTAILLALVFVFSLAACGEKEKEYANTLEKVLGEGKLVLGVSPDYAPCEFIDPTKTGTDKYVGSDIELAKYIAEQLGVELVIQEMDFDAIQAAVQTGKIDIGISGFSWTPERAEAVYLSDMYNMNDYGQGLLVLSGQESVYITAEDFAGKKVAAQNGSLQYTLCSQQLPEDIDLTLIGNINEGVMMLLTNKVDALAVSGENGLALVNANEGIAMCDFSFTIEDEGYVCMIQMGQDEFLAEINTIIADVVGQELYVQWLSDAMDLQAELGVE